MAYPPSSNRKKSVIIALAAVAAPILLSIVWDLYSQRIGLELRLVSQSVLVERTGSIEKLTVDYGGRRVPGLSRVELVLINTGRKPIRSTDVVSPITVVVDSGQILDVRLEESAPSDFAVTFQLDSSRNSVTVETSLINPGDAVRFSLLLGFTPPPKLSAATRIVGLKALYVTDRRPERRSLWRVLPWPVYVAGFGTLVAFVLLATFLYVVGYARRGRHYWAGIVHQMPAGTSVLQFRQTLTFAFGPDAGWDQVIPEQLSQTDPKHALTAEELRTVKGAIEMYVRRVRLYSHWATIVALLLFLVGMAYVFYSLTRYASGIA